VAAPTKRGKKHSGFARKEQKKDVQNSGGKRKKPQGVWRETKNTEENPGVASQGGLGGFPSA